MSRLLHELILRTADRTPEAEALKFKTESLTYGQLASLIQRVAGGLIDSGLQPGQRVAVYSAKSIETVVSLFAATLAGGVGVPINPVLKAPQVAHIMQDSDASVLVTTAARWDQCREALAATGCQPTLILMGEPLDVGATCRGWDEIAQGPVCAGSRRSIDMDVAAILYTSGSTGRPKGVVLSHRNMVTGAESVAEYLDNRPSDKLLAVLPLSFDYGFSQLTTAFHSGASAVLFDYLLPKDILRMLAAELITGLAGVPTVWTQLASLEWPGAAVESLRYITNSGGAMPGETLKRLRAHLRSTSVYLMYGLTEAFRSTYLPPDQVDSRPDSIGKAIPNAEILVVRSDGSPCEPGEEGELVHRGSLVALGYWKDPGRTAERFRPCPLPQAGVPTTELAVWSGDTVRCDEEGFIYFVGRRDEMIKTSGYRVSPTEIEEQVYDSGLVIETAAVGVPHPTLGQGIIVVLVPGEDFSEDALVRYLSANLPNFMVPQRLEVREELPRSPNGKIDRKSLAAELAEFFTATA